MSNKNIDNQQHLTLDMPLQRMERHAWVEMPLPDWRALLRYSGWMVGRLGFSTILLANTIVRESLKILINGCNMLELSLKTLLKTYDALPHMGTPLQAVTVDTTATTPVLQPSIQASVHILDLIAGKHVLIVGSTGTGKSTLAQWLASQLASQVRVYDPDATPQEWQGLEVIGRGGDFPAIASAMEADLEELENRCQMRGKSGDAVLAGKDLALIAEEFPALANELDVASDWLGKIARRGRKPKMFLCALSQSDTVAALGIEGDGAIRSNFRYVRLGSHAVTHARKLKRDDFIQWLQLGKYRCMVDDELCQLPDVRGYMGSTTGLQQTAVFPPVVTLETTVQQGLQPPTTPQNQPDEVTARAVKACLDAGLSDSRVIKEVLGYQGNKYQEGKQVLEQLKGKSL